jgi:hypothetical protein
MTKPVIETPRGQVVTTKAGRARLIWNTKFVPKWQGNYTQAQKMVDSEVLRLSEPYTPLLTGTLVKTGILGTDIGSGTVQWIAPYSAAQYYSPRKPGSVTGALRGPYWFQRGKAVWGQALVKKARKMGGGGA